MNAALLAFIARRHGLTVLLCVVPPILVCLAGGLIFPSFREQQRLVDLIPEVFRSLFQHLDLATPAGFFGAQVGHPITLAAFAVAAGVPTMALPAAERGRGALELLLATRLERRTLVLTVAASVVPAALLVGCAPFAGALLGSRVAGVSGDLPWPRFALVAANSAALVLALGGLALLISVLSGDRGAATLRYGAGAFLFAAIDLTGRGWRGHEWLSYLTPNGYLSPGRIVTGRGEPWGDVLVLLAVAGVSVAAAAFAAERRRSA